MHWMQVLMAWISSVETEIQLLTIVSRRCWTTTKAMMHLDSNAKLLIFSSSRREKRPEKPFNRCAKYQLDESKTKRLQLFDLSKLQTPATEIKVNDTMQDKTIDEAMESSKEKESGEDCSSLMPILDATMKMNSTNGQSDLMKPKQKKKLDTVLQIAKVVLKVACDNKEMLMGNAAVFHKSKNGQAININTVHMHGDTSNVLHQKIS